MRRIPLTQGKYALVDDDDYEYLSQFKWGYASGYAVRGVYIKSLKNKMLRIWMHREILGTPQNGYEIDHINGKRNDNRKKNLRFCTRSQNMANRLHSSNTSGYKGVNYIRANKWRSRIMIKNKPLHIGYFSSKEQAALAYNEKAKELFGSFALLNKI